MSVMRAPFKVASKPLRQQKDKEDLRDSQAGERNSRELANRLAKTKDNNQMHCAREQDARGKLKKRRFRFSYVFTYKISEQEGGVHRAESEP
jgi:hypothetical protein